MSTEAIAALSGLFGVLLGAAGQALTAWFQSSREKTKDDRDFSQSVFDRLERRIVALEKAEDECRRDKETLLVKVGALEAEVEALRREVQRFEERGE